MIVVPTIRLGEERQCDPDLSFLFKSKQHDSDNGGQTKDQHCKVESTDSPEKDSIQIDSSSEHESDQDIDFEKSAAVRTKNSSLRAHCSKEKTSASNLDASTHDIFANFTLTESSVVNKTSTSESDVGAEQKQSLLLHFPSEITLKIFSYLGPKDLCRCAQVCRLWSQSARDGELWRELYPVRWIFRKDWRFGADVDDMCSCNCDSEIQSFESGSMNSTFANTDADKESCSDTGSSSGADSDSESPPEMQQLLGLVRYLVPRVGLSVWVLKLGCCPVLSNGLAFKILSHCPNVRHLDLSQNAVSDFGLKGLFRKGGGLHLQHLDVSGCKNITDKTLFKLSSSLGKLPADSGISDIEDSSCDCHTSCSCGKLSSTTPKTVKRGLVYLGLSGCYQITDAGLRTLAKYGGLPKLRHLDLSGCLQVTAEGLLDLVQVCPNLDHTEFFYCDNIDEGPYPDTASGCQNLECKNRVCCRTGQ